MNSAFAIFATAALLCSVAFSTHNSIDFINEIRTYEVELPISLSGGSYCWRIWGTSNLGTRLATGTDSNKNIYLGCSSSRHDGSVFKVDATNRSEVISEHKFSGLHVRGLYVHPDGSYGVLLWDSVNSTHKIYVAKVDKNNKEVWRTELYNEYVIADSFWVGDGRFEYGNGEYRAYYHVHGASGYMEGHEGDAYYTVNKTGHVKTLWNWGCSHSMSNLLRFILTQMRSFLSVIRTPTPAWAFTLRTEISSTTHQATCMDAQLQSLAGQP